MSLFFGLNDGRAVKINGVGNSGANMFALDDHGPGQDFTQHGNDGTLAGSQVFKQPVTCVAQGEGCTLLGFADGRVLKVKGIGGDKANMFALVDNGPGNHFDPSGNY